MKLTIRNHFWRHWRAGVLGCLLLAAPAIAAPDEPNAPSPSRSDSLDSIPRGGRPLNRTDAGDRGFGAGLVALIPCPGTLDALGGECPTDASLDPAELALTSDQNPTLWLALPASSLSDRRGELVLLADGEIVHKERFALSDRAGIVPVPVNYDLEPGRVYWWVFSELHSEYHPTRNPTVEGIIRYQPVAGIAARLWYDELDALASRRLAGDTPTLQQTWTQLLRAAGLPAVADAPLLERNALEPVSDED